MTWNVWTKTLTAGVCALLALSAAVAAEAQAAFTPDRSTVPGTRTYANASVVAVDARAGTITVRGGGVGKAETFPVEAQALQRVGALKPGEQVVLTLRAGGPGPEVVTQIERSVAGAAAPRGKTSGRPPRRRGPTGTASPATSPAPVPAPSPAISPAPSPEPSRPPTDIVGPFRDPRVDPNFDPRQAPLRDPRVIPGLSEPAPSPSASPTPSPTPTPSPRS
jgi:hypothetical protein